MPGILPYHLPVRFRVDWGGVQKVMPEKSKFAMR